MSPPLLRSPFCLTRFFFFGGFAWVLVSFGVNIMRVFSLQLLNSNTYIQWLTARNVTDDL